MTAARVRRAGARPAMIAAAGARAPGATALPPPAATALLPLAVAALPPPAAAGARARATEKVTARVAAAVLQWTAMPRRRATRPLATERVVGRGVIAQWHHASMTFLDSLPSMLTNASGNATRLKGAGTRGGSVGGAVLGAEGRGTGKICTVHMLIMQIAMHIFTLRTEPWKIPVVHLCGCRPRVTRVTVGPQSFAASLVKLLPLAVPSHFEFIFLYLFNMKTVTLTFLVLLAFGGECAVVPEDTSNDPTSSLSMTSNATVAAGTTLNATQAVCCHPRVLPPPLYALVVQ